MQLLIAFITGNDFVYQAGQRVYRIKSILARFSQCAGKVDSLTVVIYPRSRCFNILTGQFCQQVNHVISGLITASRRDGGSFIQRQNLDEIILAFHPRS